MTLEDAPEVSAQAGKEIREGLREKKFGRDEAAKRRWGLLQWLRKKRQREAGRQFVGVARFAGILLLVLMFLGGVGLIRGLVTDIRGTNLRGFNIWVMLAATLGVQWLFLIGSILGYFIMPKITGGLDWFRELMGVVLKKLSGRMNSSVWRKLTDLRSGQKSAVAWRLGRILQLGGVGLNLGLLIGLFGVLWFLETHFFWESSLAQFGPQSLNVASNFLSLGISWFSPGIDVIEKSRLLTDSAYTPQSGLGIWKGFFLFAIFFWGLLPRVVFFLLTVRREQKVLSSLQLQDPAHRKLWREITRVERTVVIEGPSDGVVLLDVGGLNLDVSELRPFLLQTLRVNPEKSYSVGVLNEAKEKEAWEAMKKAPCGVVMLVEGWSLSPKQMKALVSRIREEAGEETVLRVLVLGDGVEPPEEEDFAQWQKFIDALRDPNLECIAYEEGVLQS